MDWQDKVGHKLDVLGNYLIGGTHAIPKEDPKTHWIKRLPSSHRLYNALGMFTFFLVGGWVRDVMRGFDEKGEKIEKADVPHPLRFLHGALAHNPHSDAAHDRWFKIICQIIPATFGATGAILGSIWFFDKNMNYEKRAKLLRKYAIDKTGDGLGAFQCDDALAHYESWPMRILAGVFATFSAASGLTVLYGMFLNSAFSYASNRKMFAGAAEITGIEAFRGLTNTTGNTQFGPVFALDKRIIGESKLFFERHARLANGDANYSIPPEEIKEFQTRMIKEVIAPLFPEYAATHENELRNGVTKMFTDAWKSAAKAGATPKDIGVSAMNFIKGCFAEEVNEQKDLKYRGGKRFILTLFEYFGMSAADMKKANLDNNGWLGQFSSLLMKPFGSEKVVQAFTDSFARKVDATFSTFGEFCEWKPGGRR